MNPACSAPKQDPERERCSGWFEAFWRGRKRARARGGGVAQPAEFENGVDVRVEFPASLLVIQIIKDV